MEKRVYDREEERAFFSSLFLSFFPSFLLSSFAAGMGYDALQDTALAEYLTSPRMFNHLKRAGLVTDEGKTDRERQRSLEGEREREREMIEGEREI
jgi:hypothetical protein